MTVTTETADAPVGTTETTEDTPVRVVERLRESLHRAAREGKLNDEVADGIAYSFVAANSALDPARALIMFARAIEAEAEQRRTAPTQNCGNPMGQTNVPSCAELVLTKHEAIAAAKLADDLVTGPWPLF